MRLRAYPRYKPSGVESFALIPEHWEVKRLKTSARCWVSNVDKIPADDELPVRLCNYTDVYYHEEITPDMELMGASATVDEVRRFGLEKGDVVITKDSEDWRDIGVPALVRESAPDLVCGYHLAIIRSNPTRLLGEFLLRALQSCVINQQFQLAASGVTRYGLPKSSIGDALIPIPDIHEQSAIASFLKKETARIALLLAKKRELIERLKEKRAAVAAQTVTYGLSRAAAVAAGFQEKVLLKPSGICEVGEIPKHWKISRVRYESKVISKGTTPSTLGMEMAADGVRFLKAENVGDGVVNSFPEFFVDPEIHQLLSRSQLAKGDVLVVIAGATTGKAAVLNEELLPANTNQAICFIRPKDPLYATLLAWWINSPLIQDLISNAAVQAAQPNLAMGDIRSFPCLVPPAPEQAAIIAYLDAETTKLNSLIRKMEEAIERLKEYRRSIISAAVTGQVDVRVFLQS